MPWQILYSIMIQECKDRRSMIMNRRRRKNNLIPFIVIGVVVIAIVVVAVIFLLKGNKKPTPDELITTYMNHISAQEYEEMYEMIDTEASGEISQEDFVKRNSAIYEGIEMQNMEIEVLEYNEENLTVTYNSSFDTAAGNVNFENTASFVKGDDGYKLIWEDALIFPELESTDKVRVKTTEAERGEILDRNGRVLAGKGSAASVGIVPGKLEDRESAVAQLAEILELETEAIEKKLSASWVNDDSFVPIKTISTEKEDEIQDQLLAIKGIMISTVEVRYYPLGEAAAHLVGYVQNVTAEDLEEHAGEGYTSTSVIGRSGMESLFEKELKGQNGCRIYITDENGEDKGEVASQIVEHGQDIKLTIDAELQKQLYAEFEEDKSCSVAMNPQTGEVLALVSTPTYDNNDFILGMSSATWEALNNDERLPLVNRFRQTFAPGSTFKPVTAAIGLQSGAFSGTDDFGNEGLSWQKDETWGSYKVTTLHEYNPVILKNALIYSDNIYFAKAALKIGADTFEKSLTALGFNETLPFDIKMSKSQFSNEEHIDGEIQLADSGYGQGEVLVNPLHLASIYTAFCNEGDIIKPYLVYKEDVTAEKWIEGAFSSEVANEVLEGIKAVVNDPNGTAYSAHRSDVVLAGKTGTAEIKASQDDTTGTELGWFAVMTAEETAEKPILIVSMVEDVKNIGGSGYVVRKTANVLEDWF